jgi:hypothetical protein
MNGPCEPYFELLPALGKRFSEAGARYVSLRDSIRPSITRWQWASWPGYELEPFGMWLLGHPRPGRLIKSEPKSKNGKFHHGYNANSRVVLAEEYTEFEGRFYEQYIEYFDDRIESTYYSYAAEKDCINVETLLLDRTQPIAFLGYAVAGQSVAAYDYDQGRISRIWRAHQQRPSGPHTCGLILEKGTVIYEGGAPDRIEVETEGYGTEVLTKDGRRRSVPLESDSKPASGASANLTMNPKSAKNRLMLALEEAGRPLATLTLEQGVELMLTLYREQRAKGCSLAEDGDMLLFQWGPREKGQKELFEIDITRQFIETDYTDGAMRQLSLAFRFPMHERLRGLATSDRWCRTPDELDEFRNFIQESAAWKAAAELQPLKVVVSFGEV